jgi:hypothetical protein
MRTPMQAIKTYCRECGDGTPKEVRLCHIVGCPLYLYRQGRRPTEDEVSKHEKILNEG